MSGTVSTSHGRTSPAAFAHDVLRALSKLDRRESDALRLIYFHRFTQDQVAAALGLSRTAVSRVVAHGLFELSDALLDPNPTRRAPTS